MSVVRENVANMLKDSEHQPRSLLRGHQRKGATGSFFSTVISDAGDSRSLFINSDEAKAELEIQPPRQLGLAALFDYDC